MSASRRGEEGGEGWLQGLTEKVGLAGRGRRDERQSVWDAGYLSGVRAQGGQGRGGAGGADQRGDSDGQSSSSFLVSPGKDNNPRADGSGQ